MVPRLSEGQERLQDGCGAADDDIGAERRYASNSGEGRLDEAASISRSSALQLWAIGMIAPLLTIAWNIFEGGLKSDWAILWEAGRALLYSDVPPGQAIEFVYPPHALLFFVPFAPLPYALSYAAWNILTAGFFLWAARPYLPRTFPRLLAVLTPGALLSIHFGQTALLVGGLWLLAFRGKWAAVALLTFKPHQGVLSALSLRSPAAVAKTAIVALVLVAASIAILGIEAWKDFLLHLMSYESQFTERRRWSFLGVSPGIAYGLIGWLPFAFAAGILLMRKVNAFTAATAALLVAPYGFSYDMPTACLGIGLAIYSHWHVLGWPKRLALMVGFLAPTLASLGVWWIPPILLWTLWVQVGLPNSVAEPSRH